MRLIPVMLATALLANQPVRAAHTQASLVLDSDVASPGQVVLAGVHLQMDPTWHTYWRNSGASGQPLKVTWELPAGVIAGELLWPVPEKLSDTNATSYIYETEVVLLTPLTVAS